MGEKAAFRRGRRIAIQADVRISASDELFAEATMVDISRYGLSVDGLQHFPADALLEVAFPNGHATRGRSVWTEDFLDGIAFETPLGSEEFKALLASLRTARRSAPRSR